MQIVNNPNDPQGFEQIAQRYNQMGVVQGGSRRIEAAVTGKAEISKAGFFGRFIEWLRPDEEQERQNRAVRSAFNGYLINKYGVHVTKQLYPDFDNESLSKKPLSARTVARVLNKADKINLESNEESKRSFAVDFRSDVRSDVKRFIQLPEPYATKMTEIFASNTGKYKRTDLAKIVSTALLNSEPGRQGSPLDLENASEEIAQDTVLSFMFGYDNVFQAFTEHFDILEDDVREAVKFMKSAEKQKLGSDIAKAIQEKGDITGEELKEIIRDLAGKAAGPYVATAQLKSNQAHIYAGSGKIEKILNNTKDPKDAQLKYAYRLMSDSMRRKLSDAVGNAIREGNPSLTSRECEEIVLQQARIVVEEYNKLPKD